MPRRRSRLEGAAMDQHLQALDISGWLAQRERGLCHPGADGEAGFRFVDPAVGDGVIDVIRPNRPGHALVFQHRLSVLGRHYIPELEMGLAAKFASFRNQGRVMHRRYWDAGDFFNVFERNRYAISMAKLDALAEGVRPGGAAELREVIEHYDAGRIWQVIN